MLGQKANHLDFGAIMDEGKILLLDLGQSDGEINRLIGSLVVTGLELAMRRRRNRDAGGAIQRADQGHLWDWPSWCGVLCQAERPLISRVDAEAVASTGGHSVHRVASIDPNGHSRPQFCCLYPGEAM